MKKNWLSLLSLAFILFSINPRFAEASSSPTVQTFTSGSGTYTTPTNPAPLYIHVYMVGGGGGGGGGGQNSTVSGYTGGNTTFGSSLLVANGGGAGNTGSSGGSASIASPAYGQAVSGTTGGGYVAVNSYYAAGGYGGNSPFGGAGGGTANAIGVAAAANSGSGGGGGGTTNAAGLNLGASGGAAGGYVDAIIASPSSTYSYAVGAGGSGGAAGTNGYVGGAGGSGVIIVEEYYSNSQWTTSGSNIYYNTGDVGIGTSSPVNPLDVVGGLILRSASPNIPASGVGNYLHMGYDSANGWAYIASRTNALVAEPLHIDATPLVLNVNGGAGNVGIGTTSPSYTLQVNGSVAGSSAYVNTSDARLKKDIKPISYGLDAVLNLRPIEFNWKTQDQEWKKQHQIGLIAQDVEDVIPEVVFTADDDMETKGIAYGSLVPVLIKATQEQQAEINELRSELEAYKKDHP